jgi:excisionase family DNA binding protein
MPDPEQPRWATLREAADYAPISLATMRRWVQTGRIPAVRLGPRDIRVNLNDIDRARERLPMATGRLTAEDKRLAREVAAALLPLADWQKEKLALLLNPGPPGRQQDAGGEHDAA